MEATATGLDGEALAWFQWEESRRSIMNWGELKTRLLGRFRQTQEGTLCDQFLSLRQEGLVRDYLHNFESLAAVVDEEPEHVQESTFINGLKPEIRAKVRMMKPKGLTKVMKLAQRVEERNAYDRSNRRSPWMGLTVGMGSAHSPSPYGSRGPPNSYHTPSHPTQFKVNPLVHGPNPLPLNPHPPTMANPQLHSIPNSHPSLSVRPPSQRNSVNYKKLSDAELQSKIERGLCFQCDTKYSLGQRC